MIMSPTRLGIRVQTGTMTDFILQGDPISLAQAVKVVGLAGSGGQSKHLVRSGAVTVNGVVETQPGRKLHAGDRFGTADGREWTVRQ
jgi:ribosome-associated protein